MRIELPQLARVLDFSIPAKGIPLLSVLVSHQIPLGHSCGGEGVCGTCWVELTGVGLPLQDSHSKRLWKKQFPQTIQNERQYFACLVKLTVSDSSKTWVLRCSSW